ncbi:MAG: MFS transporter [Paludibacteraceae bacterium]|nr:MFS transporter [Paludibacteraceae bacterium]
MLKRPSFFPLYFTNFWGVLNDNFLKTLACFTAVGWVDGAWHSTLVGTAAGALVLPYILFSPLAERFTFLYEKKKVVRLAKWAELPIMALAILGFVLHSVALVLTAIVLMGLQSSLYSPAKYGLVRDFGGLERLSSGMGGMEAVAFLGMLSGTVAASFLADADPLYTYIVMVGCAALGLLGSYTLRVPETKSETPHTVHPLRYLRDGWRLSRQYEGLPAVIGVLCVFWWMAASLQMALIVYGPQVLQLDSLHTGLMLTLCAIGITSGCLLAGRMGQRQELLSLTPLTGILLFVLFLLLFALPLRAAGFTLLMTAASVLAGFLKVPMDTEIQRVVKGPALNQILAWFNQVSFLFILLASATFTLLCLLSVRYVLLACAVVILLTAFIFPLFHRPAICNVVQRLLRLRYRMHLDYGGMLEDPAVKLILPNHTSVLDPLFVVGHLYPTGCSPLVDERYFETPVFRHILGLFDAVMVPDLRKHRQGMEQAAQLEDICVNALAEGHSMLFYPSGHITTDGRETIGPRRLAWQVCRRLPEGVRVYGVKVTGFWDSCSSRKGRRSTPPLVTTILKNCYKFLLPKRDIRMTVEDLTDQVRTWAGTLDKMDFNARLEEYYNA